ncbi:hypothetical protein CJ030_MR8G021786 [Morella rubra]|uniref:Uncharacterized protein n=1 Tax=Morella rubra TaxID=262757 RepID=A0A6A1UW15_9ROSI|nr:hypothetical protein CJ030_MR8G021786 [Morella rubra]
MSFCSSLPSPPTVYFLSKSKYSNGDHKSPVISRFRASADVPDFLSADCIGISGGSAVKDSTRFKFSAEEAVQHQLDALKYNDQPRQDYGIEVMYRFAGFDPFERSTYFGPFFDLGQFERFRRIFHHSTYRVLLGHKDRKILSSLFIKEAELLVMPHHIIMHFPSDTNSLILMLFSIIFLLADQLLWVYELKNRTDTSRGFGYEELALKKKKYSSLPWSEYQFIWWDNSPIFHTFLDLWRQKVGGSWDGYWLTESLLHDGDAFTGGLAY